MPKIAEIRPVLLSAPYGYPDYLEVRYCLPSGHRTCGMVEITLDDGTTGLGEGYLAVFAPRVFQEIVALITPHLIGRDAIDIDQRYHDLCQITGYWSMQGAARHVVGAIEIALVDANAKRLGVPAWNFFDGRSPAPLKLYGSGGDSPDPDRFCEELDRLTAVGIELFKIRARCHEVDKVVWVLNEAAQRGIRVAVDMCQNLAVPAQTVEDVIAFLDDVAARTPHRIAFLEEPLGPMDLDGYRCLRRTAAPPIYGGEIVTTAAEMEARIRTGAYDGAQPDATVIGGIREVCNVFAATTQAGIACIVHCWGGGACLMANYHAAFASGGALAEWPLPDYPLRTELLRTPLQINHGKLVAPTEPGLGVHLPLEAEKRYNFREDAVYSPQVTQMAASPWPAQAPS